MEALRQLYAQLGAEAPNRIGAVVFASPDIDMTASPPRSSGSGRWRQRSSW
jgi:esterase/lipase superfamily enzyme